MIDQKGNFQSITEQQILKMAAGNSKNFLMIHGAWGGAWEFKEVTAGLHKRGHVAAAIDLPGHGDSTEVNASEVTMEDYVDKIVEKVNAMDGVVVLVGHSLGGVTISQAAERMPEKIERIVYIVGLLPQSGESGLSLMQSDPNGELLPRVDFSQDRTYATIKPKDVAEIRLHDVKDPDVNHFAMKQSTEPFMFEATLSESSFGAVPKTYVRTKYDKVVSPLLQERMIQSWNVENVETMESGHFPLISMPNDLVEVLDKVVSR